MPANFKDSKAFTLIEIVVVIAIIAILAAILFPAFARAKHAGFVTQNIAHMKQLGLSAALYASDNGAFPQDFVALSVLPEFDPRICASPLDPSEIGIANSVNASYGSTLSSPTSFKRTYVSNGDLGIPNADLHAESQDLPGDGWLIDPTDLVIADFSNVRTWKGTYRRLRFDGGVFVKRFSPPLHITLDPGAPPVQEGLFFDANP